MNEQPEKQGFKLSEVIIIVVITCAFSIFAGISYGKIKYSDVVKINNLSDSDDTALNEFIKNYNFIIKNSYDAANIDEDELLNIALIAILDELGITDPYSLYMDEADYSEFNISLDGKYEGLGIEALKTSADAYVLISRIIDNSPASKVNLKADDYILAIDGKSTKDMTVKEFSQYIRDSADKQFILKIKRGEESFTVTIKKGKIELDSVESRIIEQDNKKVGYMYISVFAANTYTQFKEHLTKLEKENMDALIIDVRDNTGGHLTEVSKMLSLFLSKDKVVYQIQKNNEKAVKYYSNGSVTKKYPVVFLSNGNTASASEVLILGLKENIGASVVGTKTYGKGTVQDLMELSNGDKYKITTKRWLSPKGNWVNDTKGIEPDVSVELDKAYFKNPTDDNDNQLKEAIKQAIKKVKE